MKLTLVAKAVGHTVPRGGLFTPCSHSAIPKPPFDKEAARSMSGSRVRVVFPRFDGKCPECGDRVIRYASLEHYIAGGW